MSVGRLDHVALAVADIDDFVEKLVATGALRVVRHGTLISSGRRLVMLGDGTGIKIEVMENPEAVSVALDHIAFRCDDVAATANGLVEQGWKLTSGPRDVPAAHAEAATMTCDKGFRLQVLDYRPTSPDIIEWVQSPDAQPQRQELRGTEI